MLTEVSPHFIIHKNMKHILECISSFKRTFLLLSTGFGRFMFHSCVLHSKSYLFCNWKSVLFDHFQSFFSYFLPTTSGTYQSVLYKSILFLFWFYIYIYNEILQYLHFSMWLISLRMMHSRSICVSQMVEFPAFYGWIIFCCVCVFVFVYTCTHKFSLSIHLPVNT